LCDVAERVLARRSLQLSDTDRQLIADVFGLTAKYRGGYK
jgi:hypothetical protein